MDFKALLKVGLKVCVAAAAGLVIFIGIDRVNDEPGKKGNERVEGGPKKTGMENLTDNEPVKKTSVVQKMRNVQGTLGKLFACVQALTIVVENFKKVFSGPGESGYYCGQPYYTGSPFYTVSGPSYCEGGIVMNRISPFITEVMYDRNYRGI